MSPTDLAYIAGFFDGEGSCGLALGKYNTRTGIQSYQPNATITNTDKEILLFIQKALGLGFMDSGTQQKQHWKMSHKLWLPQHHLVKFLTLILPYLRLKRRQAELVIEFCSLKADYKDISLEQQARRAAIYVELSELNKRGC